MVYEHETFKMRLFNILTLSDQNFEIAVSYLQSLIRLQGAALYGLLSDLQSGGVVFAKHSFKKTSHNQQQSLALQGEVLIRVLKDQNQP